MKLTQLYELVVLAYSGLIQNKTRFFLTSLGVAAGSFGLVLILAVGQGLEHLIFKQFQQDGQLRQILVIPGFGTSPLEENPVALETLQGNLPPEQQERLRRTLSLRRYRGPSQQTSTVPLSHALVEEIEALPEVEYCETMCQDRYWVEWEGYKSSTPVIGMGVSPGNASFQERILLGKPFQNSQAKEVFLHEYFLYQAGITNTQEFESFLGKDIQIHYQFSAENASRMLEIFKRGNAFLKEFPPEAQEKLKNMATELIPLLLKNAKAQEIYFTETVKVVGILKEASRQSGSLMDHNMSLHTDLFFPMKFSQELFLRVPSNQQRGYTGLRIQVKTDAAVEEVEAVLKKKGVMVYSMKQIAKQVQIAFMGITVFIGLLAGIALVVATLGITNTMVMSVLERTKEIGIMKAIGAQDWHIRTLFFVESSYIGLCGSFLGIGSAFLLSIPLEWWGQEYIRRKAHEDLQLELFHFPWWLFLGAFLFGLLLSILAAWIPSRRATRIDPVETLRHD